MALGTLIDDIRTWLPLTAVTLISADCGDEPIFMTPRKHSAENSWPLKTGKINDSTVISINGFKGPYGVTVTDSGRIHVADIRDGGMVRFSENMAVEKWLGHSAVLSKFYSANVTLVRTDV